MKIAHDKLCFRSDASALNKHLSHSILNVIFNGLSSSTVVLISRRLPCVLPKRKGSSSMCRMKIPPEWLIHSLDHPILQMWTTMLIDMIYKFNSGYRLASEDRIKTYNKVWIKILSSKVVFFYYHLVSLIKKTAKVIRGYMMSLPHSRNAYKSP